MVTLRNFEVVKGDTKNIYMTFYQDNDNTPKDMSGYSFFFTAKINETDSDDDAVIKIDPSEVTIGGTYNNEVTITISATKNNIDVGTYYYDIQMVDGSGNVTTIFKGNYEIIQDITIRTS